MYVYESDGWGGGSTWLTHVASRRWVFTTVVPDEVPWPDQGDSEPGPAALAWLRHHQLVSAMVGDPSHGFWEPVPVGFAGQTFERNSPGECADLLRALATAGVAVPAHAIDALVSEQNELDATPAESNPARRLGGRARQRQRPRR